MSGGANFHPYPVPLGGRASSFAVVRYDRDTGAKTLLPNVLPLEVHRVEGPVPPSARFLYVFDDSIPGLGLPTAIEEVWPLSAQGDYVVRDDDELLIYEYRESGQRVLLFDGFAQVPQANLSPDGQTVTFTAVGVAVRLWDRPIGGCTMRQADDPDAGDVVATTGLPTWFNPDGRPNRTPDGKDVNGGARDGYPVFLDVNLPDDQLKSWTLADFVKYVLWTCNPDEEYVRNPSSLGLTRYLQAVTPKQGSSYYDLKDPGTYDAQNIIINSFNATNLPPVEALARQLHYYGFEIFFGLFEDSKGAPENRLMIYRKDGRDGNAPKRLYSPGAGSSLADGLPDVDVIALARDEHKVANAFAIETAPVQYEASFVLAPDFAIDPTDADNIKNFDRAKLATADDATRKKYRRFVLDEAGTGHWDFGSSSYVTKQPASLDDILGAPVGDGAPRYVTRPRPGKGTLISKDDAGRSYKATLALSRDYDGLCPAIWAASDTATWRELGSGGWKLLTDQLGIEITAENPETWTLPRDKDDTSAAKGDKVRVISSLANPSASGDKDSARFYLRLTCVIEDDSGIDATADRRDAAPGRFTVLQRIDSRDHFQKQVVCASSIHNDQAPPKDVAKRDDTDAARAKADALRAAHEMPMVAGEVRIPGIAHAVGVGDFLGGFTGKSIDLASNAGGPLGESPHYPVVVGVSYTLQDPQTTVLRLSDRRAEPERYFRDDEHQ